MGGYVLISFDPRARRGRDDSVGTAEWADRVSIHAPAGGATRPARAGRATALFRSTRPQGARRSFNVQVCANMRFDPRARRGRDCGLFRIGGAVGVSIHAPAGGATMDGGRTTPAIARFDPRARRGRDPRQGEPSVAHAAFRSTRPQGARPVDFSLSILQLTCFDPRARRGRDRPLWTITIRSRSFDPRARRGRDKPWPAIS